MYAENKHWNGPETAEIIAYFESKGFKQTEETERYYPTLLDVIKEQPEYNNAAWLLSYQIRSLLLTAKRISY